VVPVMVSKLVERSFQRHRVCSIPSSYERVMIFESWAVGRELIFGSFCPILKEKELGFKRRRREEGEEGEKKEEINKICQDHCGFSSGVIPIKVCESLVWVYPFPPHTKLVFMI
ncbi:hypothetical protein MTR67_053551, partial [Solanum verrucosum]